MVNKYSKGTAPVSVLLRVYNMEGGSVYRDIYDVLEYFISLKTKPATGSIRKANQVIEGSTVAEFCKAYPEYKVVVGTRVSGVGCIITEYTNQGTAELSVEGLNESNFAEKLHKLLNKNLGK